MLHQPSSKPAFFAGRRAGNWKRKNNMSYAQKTLLPEEKILYTTKPHYIIFFPVFLWLTLAMIFSKHTQGFAFLGSLLILIAMFSCIKGIIDYTCSEYTITNKRIIMKIGLFRRRSLELFLDRIEGIYVEQNLTGQILGFGTVLIGGIGGTKDPFRYIPKPIEFRNKVQQQIQLITRR
jgi:uncharacterized membrane protein YdbT with pleckstrin-like domain